MAGRLEDRLQPGERVVYRARTRVSDFLKSWLPVTAIFAAAIVGLQWLSPYPEPEYGLVLAGITSLYCAYILLARGEALVTDRRLLRRRGLIRRQVDELSLSQVKSVHGLDIGSPRIVQIEDARGEMLALADLPRARSLGRAVAQAAELAIATEAAPIFERAAKVLIFTNLYGPVLGIFLALLVLHLFADYLDPGPSLALIIIAIVSAGGIALVAGWVLGSLLAILYLRPLVTAEEIHAAIYVDLRSQQLMGRRTLLRLASLVYRQRIAPLDKEPSGSSNTRPIPPAD